MNVCDERTTPVAAEDPSGVLESETLTYADPRPQIYPRMGKWVDDGTTVERHDWSLMGHS